MQIGLCMMVKDEANRVVDGLRDIVDLFDQVVIFDTGSNDDTPRLLRDRLGVEPIHTRLDPARCHCHCDVRNRGFALLHTPWIMSLDADERISRDDLARLKEMDDDPSVSGYICRWDTFMADGTVVEDYKLPVFRRGVRMLGLIHDNAQYDIRQGGGRAVWLDGLAMKHQPEPSKNDLKRGFYYDRLFCAIRAEPGWVRYHWFAGYMLMRDGRTDEAVPYLNTAAESDSADFPVECLNGRMVLADVLARRGDRAGVQRVLDDALAFHQTVADDFEVNVNFRLKPWLDAARAACGRGELWAVRCYPFAC
jgi:glycosyltransferase involved in cell wall biosynthesis